MNVYLKRALAVAATAPLAFIAAVGPAGAATDNVDPTPVRNNTNYGFTITCDHPLDPALNFTAYVWDEGNLADRDDVDRVLVRATDEDWPHNSPFSTLDPINVRSVKVELFKDDADQFNDKPDRIYSDTERVSPWQRGRARFSANRDDVGFIRVTVVWSAPAGFGDDDREQLTCLENLPGSRFP